MTLLHLHVDIVVWVGAFVFTRARVCSIFVSFQCLVLCVLNNVNMYQLYRASLGTHASPEWSIVRIGGELFRHVSYVTSIYCRFLHSKFYF